MPKKKKDIVIENVLIEDIAAEGKALAHIDGMVVFVPYAAPGDVVTLRVLKKRKKYMEGKILAITKASEDRLEPFCTHFGLCGGCKWQHLPYSVQLLAKKNQVKEQFVRIAHLDNLPQINDTIASDDTEYYRNKLEFSFSAKRWILENEDIDSLSPKDRTGLGFHISNFFDKVLDIEKCYLQREPSNAIRLFIKKYAIEHDYSFFDIRENSGFLRNMFIRTADSSSDLMLIICFFYEDKLKIVSLLDALIEKFPSITSLYYVINKKLNDSIADQDCILYKGKSSIYESMEDLKFKIGPKSFYQTNTKQAYKLYSVVRDFANLSGDEIVYDLYTGTGTIAIFLARKAAKVIGIEYVEEAVNDAKENAAANNIDNCSFFSGDMKDILNDYFVKEHGKPDVIVLDPPRAGIHPDVGDVILRAQPKKIVYVSCNPASQARDLAILTSKYRVEAIQPVDMFPHTHHIENVCLLQLNSTH